MYENLIGKTFNRLTVIERVTNSNRGCVKWLCQCSCGNYSIVRTADLKCGHTKSCGCYNIDMLKNRATHHQSGTRLYKIWISLKRRCNNPKDLNYNNYGGRGITVCNEWLHSYENFKKWANENGYNESLTIDRIDVNGNYEPSNCRWSNYIDQAKNRRNSKIVTYHGETATLEEMCEKLNVNVNTIRSRMNKYGHTFESSVDDFKKTGNFVKYKTSKTKVQ